MIYSYAIQPHHYNELKDGLYFTCMTFPQAEILARKEVEDTKLDHAIWKLPHGGEPMKWMGVYYNDPLDKPVENPGDDGDLLDYQSGDVI